MTFAYPLTLGLIPFVLVCAWWLFHRRHAAATLSFGRIAHVWADRRGLAPHAPLGHRRGRGLLFAGAGILAIAALARPQWGRVEDVRYQNAREVLVALDLSRSMLADDVSPTRLDRAKLLTENLADEVRGDRIGLLLFAGTSFVQVPLSADTEVLRALLPQIDPSYIPQGGTRYGQMIETAAAAFSAGAGDRYLVVLSDGEALDDTWKTALPALQQRGIRVIALGIGTRSGALVPAVGGGATKDASGAAVLSRLEPATLEALASATGGTYRDAAAWVDIPELIAATVARGERGAFVETRTARVPDRYQWFLAPAVLCALLSVWLEFPVALTVQRTVRRLRPATQAGAAALVLFVALWASPRSASAVGDAQPERQGRPVPPAGSTLPPLPNDSSERSALEAAVDLVASKSDVGPQDYANLATATVTYATTAPHDTGGKGPRTEAISDALSAVAHGELLDPRAADWPALRRQLEELLAPPPPSQQPQDDAEKKDGEKSDQNSGDSSGSEGSPADEGGNAADSSGDEKKETSSDSRNTREAGGSEHPQDKEQATGGSDNRPEDAPDSNAGATATGGDEPPAGGAHEPAQAQSIGGGTIRNPETTGVATRAEDRLTALRQADAPAVLFDRMKAAEGRAFQQPSEKDW